MQHNNKNIDEITYLLFLNDLKKAKDVKNKAEIPRRIYVFAP